MSPATDQRNRAYTPRQRSLEDRRSRGEVACAECRRLKLKCDRTIPCSSCIKRDCAALCPNASVVTKDTTRAVIAASQHMHDDVARLRRRARALESALGNLHHKRTGSAHPLLSQDYDFGDESDDVDVDSMVDGMATLHLSKDDGMERFFGNVQLPRGAPTEVSPATPTQLPPILERCIRFFPFPTPPDTRERAIAVLRRFLPDRAHAERLLHSVFEESIFIFPAMDKDVIFNELLPGLYDPQSTCPPCATTYQEMGDLPRAFALLYAFLAQGTLLDTSNPTRESQAITFGRLSLAGLGAVSVSEKPSYLSVVALFMHSAYHLLLQKELGDTARIYSSLAFETGLQIGLHLDPKRWGLPWATVQRRRRLFWSLFQVKLWESISTGRPPAIYDPSLVDCEFPFDVATEHSPGGPKLATDAQILRPRHDMVVRVVMLTSVIEPPQYQEILALDAAIRTRWMSKAQASSLLGTKTSALKRAIFLGPNRAMILMSLHRGHFVQAMEDSPRDPVTSSYGASFRTSVHSAWEILTWLPTFFSIDPGKVAYSHPLAWTWALTAAMVVFSIIQRAPHSSCVHAILAQLEKVRDVFAAAKELGGGRAASGLITLQQLCSSSANIIANRDALLDRIAWNIEPSQDWSPPGNPQRQTADSAHDSSSATISQYCWLDDDVSDSFKSLFKSHYRDAQQYTLPSTTPSPITPPHPLVVPEGLYSYPGYLQHTSSRAHRMRGKVSAPSVLVPELHPDVRRIGIDYGQALGSPVEDTKPSLPHPGSLAGIWLTHSSQLGAAFVSPSNTPSPSSQGSGFNFGFPHYPEWL